MEIPLSEITPSPLSIGDIGKVFWWNERLFRGISQEDVADIQEMFDCGLIQTLIKKDVLVNSWIAPVKVEGYGLIIEHQVIDVLTYPKEWSFSMLKDAALLILKLNDIALEFGYQTKDCHGYNVLFKNSTPIYVDLGSFQKMGTSSQALFAYSEFMRSYYYPLKVWQKGGEFWGRSAAVRMASLLPVSAYLKFRWPILRGMKNTFLERAIHFGNRVRTFEHRNINKLSARFPSWTISFFRCIAKYCVGANIVHLKKKIERIKLPSEVTMWSNYHDGFQGLEKNNSTPRFDFVVEKTKSLGVKSILELAGNQGGLSRLLAENRNLNTITCTDADGSAVDKGYCAARKKREKINWAILNPFSYEDNWHEANVEKRFMAEAVIALAVTHHLILSQGLPLAHILEVFGRFTTKYIFIEFMPLGLYDGVAAPRPPSWYHEAWFLEEFSKKFQVIIHEKLEENRIIFIGKKLNS